MAGKKGKEGKGMKKKGRERERQRKKERKCYLFKEKNTKQGIRRIAFETQF